MLMSPTFLLFLVAVQASSAATNYQVILTEHSPTPILSSSNPVGQGNSQGCLIFNPSYIQKSPTFQREGLLVRECCGDTCTGHGRQFSLNQDRAERIAFAPCNLSTATCSDAFPSKVFNLDPQADTEDPRAFYNPYDEYYYLFYYRSPAISQSKCTGQQCTVQLSRTKTPLDASSYEYINTLPWHRNGCCFIKPKGQKTYCYWGEGPGPFEGLGISVTEDISTGQFEQVTWSHGNTTDNASSPLTSDQKWMLPLGSSLSEIKLEAGTHFHQLEDGNLITFYAAATPGWVAHGNYTVGWLIVDGQNPSKILQRSAKHILVPTFDYETLCPGQKSCKYIGERHNVIFLSSAVRIDKNKFRLFYGAGDGNVGTALVNIVSNVPL
jgi:predicted GH43/DUF377 family glycosyl hydrolase